MQNLQFLQFLQNMQYMQNLVTLVFLITVVTLVSGHPVHPGTMQGSHIPSTTWSSFGEKEALIFHLLSTAIA